MKWRYDRDGLPAGGFEIFRLNEWDEADGEIGVIKSETDARVVEKTHEMLDILEYLEAGVSLNDLMPQIRQIIRECRQNGASYKA
jgi:hypothetical protein